MSNVYTPTALGVAFDCKWVLFITITHNKMNNFSLDYCEKLISTYVNEFGGNIIQIDEGVLGLGCLLLHGAKGKKTIVINEYYINSWSSGHNIRMYNKTPKKYQKIIDFVLNEYCSYDI